MIIAGTGHRPDKLLINGRNAYDPAVYQRLVDLAVAALTKYRPEGILTGMALGWDQALADAAIALQIPFNAYIPFVGQESRWPNASQDRYRTLLAQAASIVTIAEGGYSPEAMQRRNEAMVDDCHLVLALWNGTPGGTMNCLQYARRVERRHINVWPSWQRFADNGGTRRSEEVTAP